MVGRRKPVGCLGPLAKEFEVDLPKRQPQREYRKAVLEEPTQVIDMRRLFDQQDNEPPSKWATVWDLEQRLS